MAFDDRIKDPMQEPTLLSVRITKADKHKLELYAEDNDLTVSQIVRKIIKTWIRTEELKESKRR